MSPRAAKADPAAKVEAASDAAPAPEAAPAPDDDPIAALGLGAYTAVTVIRTEEIDGHVYRRGARANVDAATLAAMRAKDMVDEQPAA